MSDHLSRTCCKEMNGSHAIIEPSDLAEVARSTVKFKLVGRAGTGWTNAVINGSIDFFRKVFIGAAGAYVLLCKNAWLSYFGQAEGTVGAGLTNCAIAGVSLLLLYWGTEVLKPFGSKNEWVYDSGSSLYDGVRMATHLIARGLYTLDCKKTVCRCGN
ncbi:hypothetical protein V1511DRAFT_535972 [Dipodascopsis uninucleata]